MNRRPSCPLQAVMSGMQLHRKTRKINKNVATFSANRHHTKNPETEAKFGVFGPSRLFSRCCLKRLSVSDSEQAITLLKRQHRFGYCIQNPETEAKFGVFGPSRLFSLLSETSVRL